MGFKLTKSGVSPINDKVQGITERLRPKNLKELRSCLGAVNQLNNFIPELATLCAPFRSILKRDAEWKWEKEHEEAFKKVSQEVKNVTELTHFKRDRPLRVICDASKEGLGAVLQQCVSYASRFLSEFEANFSINEIDIQQ